jgi:hypothetical protein
MDELANICAEFFQEMDIQMTSPECISKKRKEIDERDCREEGDTLLKRGKYFRGCATDLCYLVGFLIELIEFPYE